MSVRKLKNVTFKLKGGLFNRVNPRKTWTQNRKDFIKYWASKINDKTKKYYVWNSTIYWPGLTNWSMQPIPGRGPRAKTAKEIQAEKELSANFDSLVAKFFGSNNFKIETNKGNGNCFFFAVESAYGGSYSVDELREIIANTIDERTYANYKEFYEVDNSNDFKFMKHMNNPIDLRRHIMQSNWWIDSNGIQKLESFLNIKFIIFDQRANNIVCSTTGSSGVPEFYIMLKLSGEHYELIYYWDNYEDKEIKRFTFDTLPYEVKNVIVKKCVGNSDFKEFFGGKRNLTRRFRVARHIRTNYNKHVW